SLLAGTPVFRSEATYLYPRHHRISADCRATACSGAANGFASAGSVVYVGITGPNQHSPRDVISHELGHVAQFTRDALLFAVPAHDAVIPRLGRVGRWVDRVVVVDAFLPLSAVNELLSGSSGSPRVDNWYERETEAMRGERH